MQETNPPIPMPVDHADEQDSHSPRLELAHVLFMDVVSYSLLPIDHQREIIFELQHTVVGVPEFIQAHNEQTLICLPTGDGMALAFFGDPTLPVRCARHISMVLKEHPKLKLRMGIHSGPVYRVDDINTNTNVAGEGINFAQRVMDCGDAGHILISKPTSATLGLLSTWKEFVHHVGEVEVKHGIRIEIVNLFSEKFGNPETPAKLRGQVARRVEHPAFQQAPPMPPSLSEPGTTGAGTATAPIQPVAYDPWTPVVPPNFVGRKALLSRLQNAMDEGRSVSLVGDWRIGKSSVLKTFLERLTRSGRTAKLLNGNDHEGSSPADFVEAATGKKPGNTPDLAADVLSAWARQHQKPGLHPVLLVDEVDKLIVRFDHRFFERLRGMLDYLCLVVSSRRELDGIYKEIGLTSPFHNRLELCWVGLLENDAAGELSSRPSALINAETCDMVRDWSGRHPFFIQLFGRKITDSIRYGETLEDAKEQFLAESGGRLRELWATLTDRDKDSLREAAYTPQPQAMSLRRRGLLAEDGRPFGRVLVKWLEEESR